MAKKKWTRAIRQRRVEGQKGPRWITEFFHPLRLRWEFLEIRVKPRLILSDGKTWFYQDQSTRGTKAIWDLDSRPHKDEEIPAECNWVPPTKR